MELIHKHLLSIVLRQLKSQLIGEASNLIDHLTITKLNCVTAWELCLGYNNERILASTFIRTVIDQPSGTSDAEAVKHLHDITQECLHVLNNLGLDTKSWDPLLIHF